MKKVLFITRNQQGFILPFSLFIISILLLLFTIQITIFKNDIQITHNHQEQLKIETLIQMGREKFKRDIVSKQQQATGTVTYKFPPGNVTIDYQKIDPSSYRLAWDIASSDKTYRKRTIMKLDQTFL